MSKDHSPYVPVTVPELVARLHANMARWEAMHAAAVERAKAEAERRRAAVEPQESEQ